LTYPQWDAQRAPDEISPGEFKFMPPDDVRRVVMERQVIAPQLFRRLLMAYLGSMGEYGWRGARLDIGRAPFSPDPVLAPQIQALIDCGYLKRSGAMVEWTDRIAEAMTAEGLWT
jgi:hypothetical protein